MSDKDISMRKQEGGLKVKGIARQYDSGKPLVTIITVIYNDGEHIEDIIKNVTSQTYPNIEYIIIDGGSTDGTLDVIKKYADTVDYWVSEGDKGIYDAMNKGVRVATGEWVNFMNAGDAFYRSTTIAEVIEAIPPSADLVYGHTYYKEDEKLTLIKTYNVEHLWMSMICSHQSLFVRTSILKKRPFDLRYKISSDFDFIYYCYVNKHTFFDTNKKIAVHSVDGISEQNIITRMMERWRIVNSHTPSLKVNIYYFQLLFRKIKRTLGMGN
jgi:glycosyltransferase involved in cell wall biosynthesis